MNKFLNLYVKAKNEKTEIDYNLQSSKIYELAKQEKKLYIFNKDKCIYFCLYRTMYKNEMPAIIVTFIINLTGISKGSSSSANTIMELVSDIVKLLGPMESTHYNTVSTEDNNTVGFLKFVKVISETDMI